MCKVSTGQKHSGRGCQTSGLPASARQLKTICLRRGIKHWRQNGSHTYQMVSGSDVEAWARNERQDTFRKGTRMLCPAGTQYVRSFRKSAVHSPEPSLVEIHVP